VTPEIPTMRHRLAAQTVIERLLLEQSILAPRSRKARIFGQTPLGADSVAWYLGAKGEIAVGELLAKLPPEWTVFHALPVGIGGTDIDHLVVGPGGVFTINTKHHRGKNVWVAHRTMMVSGNKVPHIRHAEFEAERVTRLLRQRMPLRSTVRPVLALVEPRRLRIREKPTQVKVVDSRDLRRWLLTLPSVLEPLGRIELAALIDDPATWGAHPPVGQEGVMERFTVLDASVRRARLHRRLWMFVGASAVAGAGALTVPPLATALVQFLTGLIG